MNIEISPEMMKWEKEILESFGGPMFFLFDNELVNLYAYLSRLSDSELQGVCKDAKFQKMCDTVIGERKSDYGELTGFVNERGMLNIEGLLPILSSFPSFNDAMNFIMRIKPGFRYTPQFKDFVEKNIQVETSNYTGALIYTLGDYRYLKDFSPQYQEYRIEYLKLINGKWVSYRKNGASSASLGSRDLLLSYSQGYNIKDIAYYGENQILFDDNIEYNKMITIFSQTEFYNEKNQKIEKRIYELGDVEVAYSTYKYKKDYDEGDKFKVYTYVDNIKTYEVVGNGYHTQDIGWLKKYKYVDGEKIQFDY